MLSSYKFYVEKEVQQREKSDPFNQGCLPPTLNQMPGYDQAHFRTGRKIFHFQNAPEETDQTTIFNFLGDLKKLKDSLCR